MDRKTLRALSTPPTSTDHAGQPSPATTGSTIPSWVVPIGVVTTTLMAILMVVAWHTWQQNDQLQLHLADRNARLEEAAARPTDKACEDGSETLSELHDLVQSGRMTVAAGLAESHLARSQPPLCDAARVAIAGLWYEAQMDLLLSTPRPSWYERSIDRQVLSRWREIESQATTFNVPDHDRWPAMTVATRAQQRGHWALADAAFRRAWAAGETHEAATAARYTLLRNWGHNLALVDGPTAQEDATRILRTAVAVADTYGLTSGEACQDLQQLLDIPDCRSPEPDPTEPLLESGQVSRVEASR